MRAVKYAVVMIGAMYTTATQSQDLETTKRIAESFPDEHYVILHQNVKLTGIFEDGKLVFYEDTEEQKLFLNQTASLYLDESVQYNTFSQLMDIEAEVLYPFKGKKYKKQKVKEFTDSDVFDSSIFYHDIKKRAWSYPELGPNYITSIQYKYRFPEAHFLSSNFMQSNVPIMKNTYTITIPNSVDMGFVLWNMDGHDIAYSETRDNKETTYSWTYENVPGVDTEAEMPPFQQFIPIVIPYVKSYEVESGKKVVLAEMTDLFNIYEGFIDEVDNTPTPEIDSLVEEITRGKETDFDRASAIFYWVQDNIKYIAFEDGLGGFIPRPCSLVFQRKYGDCKDMTSMLMSMLTSADIPVFYTWIGTRDLPYRYDEVWTPIVDNHMIAACEIDGEIIFLDGTGDYLLMGYPSPFTQGKQALVRMGEGEFELIEVPAPDSGMTQIVDTVTLRIQDGDVIGLGSARFTGYFSTSMKDLFNNVKPKDHIKAFSSYFEKGNNRFKINELSFHNTHYDSREVNIKYEFKIPQYAYVAGDEMYINLHLDSEFGSNRIDSKRQYPIEKRYKNAQKYIVKLEIPEGWKIAELPEPSEFIHQEFGFRMTYSADDKYIVLTTENYMNTLTVETDDFNPWNEMVNSIKKAYSESLVLIKSNP